MVLKLLEISTRALKTISMVLSVLGVILIFILPCIIHLVSSVHMSDIFWYIFPAELIVIILSFVFKYHAYKRERMLHPKNTVVKIQLPVTNKKMKTVWILFNLLGLAFILVALFINIPGPTTVSLVLILLGVICMALSYVFKRYAYKNDNINYEGKVS